MIKAFTLIELLVVIAVIAILAALVIPVSGAVNAARTKRRAMAELAQVETAIERYKAKLGHYPPDNPRNPVLNQLYYELLGTTLSNNAYTTLDGSTNLPQALLGGAGGAFGPDVAGFVNSSKGGGGDDGSTASSFINGLKPAQIGTISVKRAYLVRLLVSVPWQQGPPPFNFDPVPGAPTLNPWRYNYSAPTNNPNSFDLWLDVIIGAKAYRICNWSKQPLRINTP